jgi:hypothetical protein
MKQAVNDIWQCLEDAQALSEQFSHDIDKDGRVFKVFISLAGDHTIGFLAFVIWKGRNSWLSSLRTH